MTTLPERDLFLGGDLDPASKERTADLTAYDPDRFTTHGVIVGMTGSGKTGLGIVVLEEVLLRGIPALIIDPKGDLTNLALTFPDLAPADFAPWVDPGEASKAGQTPEQFAEATATSWREGLAGWGIEPSRVRELHDKVRFTIYTPGSSSGIPLNLVGSLTAPAAGTDPESVSDEIEGFVSGLLAMAGIEADPLTSPEHIFLVNLIGHAWGQGRSLDLAGLLAMIQDPPIRKLGVIDLDTFYPPKDRTGLLVRLNGLLASPSFQAWSQGPPADIASMLWAPDGRPSAAIVSLAHLADEERQFVVTLLFSKLITWMRAQPGTASLRAMAYMDEVFGYVPPNGMPPAKKPILTLLKQARAFGVGLVLATQNPVDIDYKALSNAGTWMVGRLQTERDKARLLEGMTSASGGVDVAQLDATISELGKRQFVLHSTSANAPKLFTTRWAMSYLRGPMTREQIARLTADAPERQVAGVAGVAPAAAGGALPPPPPLPGHENDTPVSPAVADGTPVFYLDPAAAWAAEVGAVSSGTRFAPAVVARVNLLYDDAKAGLNQTDEWEAVLYPLSGPAAWEKAKMVDYDDRDLRPAAPANATYQLPDADLAKAAWFRDAEKDLVSHLRSNQSLALLRNKALDVTQRPGETNEAFGLRCQAVADQKMDEAADAIREKLSRQKDKIALALQQATERVDDLESDQKRKQTGNLLQAAGSLLGGLLGGRRSSRSLAKSLGSAAGRMTKQTSASLDTAERAVQTKRQELDQIEDELATELLELDQQWDAKAAAVESIDVRLEASDISVRQLAVVWVPTA